MPRRLLTVVCLAAAGCRAQTPPSVATAPTQMPPAVAAAPVCRRPIGSFFASPPPGHLRLPAGYRHLGRQGVDTDIGVIWKPGGVRIDYDIGGMAGNHALSLPLEERVSIVQRPIGRYAVYLTRAKDGTAYATVTHNSWDATPAPSDPDVTIPANFVARATTDEQAEALAQIALSYAGLP